jgi:hypothetical protein
MSARAHGGVLTASKDGSKRGFLPPGARSQARGS